MARHVTRFAQMRNAYRIFIGKNLKRICVLLETHRQTEGILYDDIEMFLKVGLMALYYL